MKKIILVAAALIVSGFAHATPVIMNFESVTPDNSQVGVGNTYKEAGFQLYNGGAPDDAAVVTGYQNSSGSSYYTWNSQPNNQPVLSAIDGDFFSLFSLNVGSKSGGGAAANFSIIGYFLNGGTITEQVTNVSAFTSLSLTGFENLSRVTFNFVSGDFGAIDNLELAEGTVPEPTTLALMALGCVAFGISRRKKQIG